MNDTAVEDSAHSKPAPTPHCTGGAFPQAVQRLEGGRRATLLAILLVLLGFGLGGCTALWMVRTLILRMMAIYQETAEALAIYNLLDHLIPYAVGFGIVLLLGAAGALVSALHSPKPDAQA